MFINLLRETAILKNLTDKNEYGEEQYGSGISIQCKIQDGIKLVRNKQGIETVSTAVVYTNYKDIDINDKINNKTVISIKKIKECNGEVLGLGVYLE